MKINQKLLTLAAALLLAFNGIGALYGGWNLITQPDGSSIQLSLHWLHYTPFRSYFIPGLILFLANGVFSVVVLISLLFNLKNAGWLVITQGTVLTGWIVIQIMLIRTIYFLHLIMGITGLALIVIGLFINRRHVETLT